MNSSVEQRPDCRSVVRVSNKGLEVRVMLRKRVAELGCGAPFSARLSLRTVRSTYWGSTRIAAACRRGLEEGRGIRCVVRAVCVWLGVRAEQERGEDRYSTSILSMGFCLEM